MQTFSPMTASHAACKCCGTGAPLFGVVDFHKNCEEARKPNVLPLSGIPIYYHRCPKCGFIFTTAFDGFSHDQFKQSIYNEHYALVDPDYAIARPQANGQLVAKLLKENKSIRILDYGGGNGKLVELLHHAGYQNSITYDPFEPASSARPDGQFDLIVSFEVLEHTPTPKQTLTDMLSLLNQPGIVVFSTLFQPAQVDVGWWYVGPRNGHVSLYTDRAMLALAQSLGYRFASFNQNMHVLFREVPAFALPWFGGNPPR